MGLQGILLAVLPGRTHLGPVTPTGRQPRYKLNGVAAWVVTHAVLFGRVRSAALSRERSSTTTSVRILDDAQRSAPSPSAASSTGRVGATRRRATRSTAGNFIFDFFQGVELHPRALRRQPEAAHQLPRLHDGLERASSSRFAAKQAELYGPLSATRCWSSAGQLVVYLFKFFVWESGYFTSLDIMHDRFGYYICWGVLAWVPAVYTISAQYLVEPSRTTCTRRWPARHRSSCGMVAICVNYAADAQRQRVRATDGDTHGVGPSARSCSRALPHRRRQEHKNLLLVSGWWGLARHFHYVPEISLALCWSLPAGLSHFVPYFYFVFLTSCCSTAPGATTSAAATKYGAPGKSTAGSCPRRSCRDCTEARRVL